MPTSLLFALSSLTPVVAISQVQLTTPEVLWTIEGDDDSSLVLPYGLGVDASSGTLYIADLRAPGVAEIEISSGHLRRMIGRVGDGPGEVRVPQRVAVSPSGRLIAVYDVGRRAVDVYDRQWRHRRRDPVGGFNFLKSFAITDDTALVFGGGRVGSGQIVVGVTWITPNGIFNLPPYPPDDPSIPENERLDTRLYAGGGPGVLHNGAYLIADAISGDLYRSTPAGSTKIADGPGTPPEVLQGIITQNPSGTHTVRFGFRQAALVEPLGDGALVYFTDESKELVEVYRLRPRTPARLVSRIRLRASVLTRADATSVVAVDHFVGGWRISRVRLPRPE